MGHEQMRRVQSVGAAEEELELAAQRARSGGRGESGRADRTVLPDDGVEQDAIRHRGGNELDRGAVQAMDEGKPAAIARGERQEKRCRQYRGKHEPRRGTLSPGGVPAAALTAYTRADDRRATLAAGFEVHIAKPVDPGELCATVATLSAHRALNGAIVAPRGIRLPPRRSEVASLAMPKAFDKWTVLPHGKIEKLEENLWRVAGTLPGGGPPRAMTVARLGDGRLVIHGAIALGDADMKELEAFGKPAFLVVPNAGHRLDAPAYKNRYPDMKVITATGSKEKVEQVVKVDDTEGRFGDDSVTYQPVEGTIEGALVVRSKSGSTLVLNDTVMNMASGSVKGFGGFVSGMLGFFGSEPKVVPLAKLMVYKDKRAARAKLEQLADTPGLKRVIVSHGEMITADPCAAIKHAVRTL